MTAREVIGAPDEHAVVSVPRPRAAELADLAVAGLYVPAGSGPAPVAGDFYEVLVLPNGRIALFVGDVSGHGEQAVGRMRALRATARAYALEQPGPASVLARLDLFMDRQGPEELATLWYGEYQPGSGLLVYASAGHPPPAVTAHDGLPVLLDVTDTPPLGTGLAHASRRSGRSCCRPGRSSSRTATGWSSAGDGTSTTSSRCSRTSCGCDPARSGTPQTIAAEILDALVPDPDRAEDDVCVLVVRRQPQPGKCDGPVTLGAAPFGY